MTPSLVDEQLAASRLRLGRSLSALEALAVRAGAQDAAQGARALVQAAGEPFLFVAAGEVKTGKSSFINALLGEEVSAVAPDPCTDRILMISWGPERKRQDEGPLFARIELPHPILKDIAVVDTPGVDSVIDQHQEITERFIPRSDLVLFVFSALNPYTRSAWDFLGLIAGQWRRKVVLVLNQADLATPAQLKINREKAVELARERGLDDPTVFVVSSALEAVQPELSGVEAVRRHIREMVTGGEHVRAKLRSLADGAGAVLAGIREAGEALRLELETDEAQSRRIAERLDAARAAAGREAKALVVQVLARYDRACDEYLASIEMELSFASMFRRSFLRFFKRKSAVPAMLEELNRAFRESLEQQVDALAREGASGLTQRLALDISDISRDLRELAGGAARPADSGGDAAGTLERRREAVLSGVSAGLDDFLAASADPARVDPLRVARMDPKAAMGGLMVLAGGLFVLSVKGVVVDVTGGVIAGSGMLLAGGVLAVGRPRLLRTLRATLREGGERLQAELDSLLAARLEDVFADVARLLEPFDADTARRRGELEIIVSEASMLELEISKNLDTPA
ncbi:dynamin family protein [Fundidesulfovibrio putealis]|uniref:dynamin family protein n=1 Tax=Fundidesulfovibrio putealis TaxID=270496 RepID=UPI000417F7C3|nr:dynamin family protein [Fundidesulfovibrio putealis]